MSTFYIAKPIDSYETTDTVMRYIEDDGSIKHYKMLFKLRMTKDFKNKFNLGREQEGGFGALPRKEQTLKRFKEWIEERISVMKYDASGLSDVFIKEYENKIKLRLLKYSDDVEMFYGEYKNLKNV